LRLSERRATNIGLLYPKVRNNIGGGIFPLTSPQPKYWGDVSPASPAALTPVVDSVVSVERHSERILRTRPRHRRRIRESAAVVLCSSIRSSDALS